MAWPVQFASRPLCDPPPPTPPPSLPPLRWPCRCWPLRWRRSPCLGQGCEWPPRCDPLPLRRRRRWRVLCRSPWPAPECCAPPRRGARPSPQRGLRPGPSASPRLRGPAGPPRPRRQHPWPYLRQSLLQVRSAPPLPSDRHRLLSWMPMVADAARRCGRVFLRPLQLLFSLRLRCWYEQCHQLLPQRARRTLCVAEVSAPMCGKCARPRQLKRQRQRWQRQPKAPRRRRQPWQRRRRQSKQLCQHGHRRQRHVPRTLLRFLSCSRGLRVVGLEARWKRCGPKVRVHLGSGSPSLQMAAQCRSIV
mmetsp:Transcript_183360/g.581503  ORF Transcript_183360/g.581503 Transcript_183360/m.581503 type:complete len:304 (-) Transcript_183360:694-1605(-)